MAPATAGSRCDAAKLGTGDRRSQNRAAQNFSHKSHKNLRKVGPRRFSIPNNPSGSSQHLRRVSVHRSHSGEAAECRSHMIYRVIRPPGVDSVVRKIWAIRRDARWRKAQHRWQSQPAPVLPGLAEGGRRAQRAILSKCVRYIRSCALPQKRYPTDRFYHCVAGINVQQATLNISTIGQIIIVRLFRVHHRSHNRCRLRTLSDLA